MAAFESRPGWRDLPDDYIIELATRLQSADNTVALMDTCERLGLFPQPVISIASDESASFAVGATAAALTSRANALASNREFGDAHTALRAALLLQPRSVAAWITMATLAFCMGDCATATDWARRVIAFSPNLESGDHWEQANAAILTESGQALAVEILGDQAPSTAVQDMKSFMVHILQACAE